jgi:hypothetical protein
MGNVPISGLIGEPETLRLGRPGGGGTPGEWQIHFRRNFGLPELVEWDKLCREVQGLPLGEEAYVISWSLEPSGSTLPAPCMWRSRRERVSPVSRMCGGREFRQKLR